MIDPDIATYLEGVIGAVEAGSYEKHCLWLHFAEDAAKYGGPYSTRYSWKETGHGYGCTVGHVGDMPVFISLLTATVDGHKLLFYHATSQVVDHRMIEKWLVENLPDTARRSDGWINRTDAGNFHNILPWETKAVSA